MFLLLLNFTAFYRVSRCAALLSSDVPQMPRLTTLAKVKLNPPLNPDPGRILLASSFRQISWKSVWLIRYSQSHSYTVETYPTPVRVKILTVIWYKYILNSYLGMTFNTQKLQLNWSIWTIWINPTAVHFSFVLAACLKNRAGCITIAVLHPLEHPWNRRVSASSILPPPPHWHFPSSRLRCWTLPYWAY